MGKSAIVLLALVAVASCATQPGAPDPLAFDEAPLFGMVYDTDNQPCAGVAFKVDGGASLTTDVRGRFVLPSLSKGEHRLEASKDGYEDLAVTFQFLNRTDVLYLRMTSFSRLRAMAEESMDQRRWEEAGGLLERAKALNATDPVFLYLQALLAYRTERYPDAVGFLEDLIDAGVREAHVYLLLADLYEKHLQDPGKAADNLAAYLELRADPEAGKRLEALRQSPGPG